MAAVLIQGHTSWASELTRARATAYCLKGITASGEEVRNGICAVSDKSLIGQILIMYQRLPDGNVGKLIGIYEIKDTGCKEGVIDVWHEDLEQCQEFMNLVYEDGCKGRIYVQIISAEG